MVITDKYRQNNFRIIIVITYAVLFFHATCLPFLMFVRGRQRILIVQMMTFSILDHHNLKQIIGFLLIQNWKSQNFSSLKVVICIY